MNGDFSWFARSGTGICCQDGPGGLAAKLENLHAEAHSRGLEWLRSEMDNTKQDELCQLAQAAGLRVRREDNVSWVSAGELREALVEHLAPEQTSVPQEFAG